MSRDVLTPSAARLWPYSPDWRGGFNVKRSFATDVSTSRNNSEQRRALRTSPRLSVDYRTVVSGSARREATQFLRAWQNKPTIIPDFARWAALTGSSIAGATTLTISPMPVWIEAGQPLVLCGASSEKAIVLSVAGSTVTLTAPLAAAWPSGSVVRPSFFGLLDGRISTKRLTPGAADIAIAFEAYPGGTPPRAVGTPFETLEGHEIFELAPDYSGAPSLGHIWPVESVDFDRGRTAQFRPQDLNAMALESDFSNLDAATAASIEQFFDRMKGRRGAFYMPTREKDFDLNSTASGLAATLITTGLSMFNDFGSIDFSTHSLGVAVFLTNGTRIFRRITDIRSTGANSELQVNDFWGWTISQANTARISLMPLWRFASDDMTTSWKTPNRADTRLSFLTVRR